MSVHLHFALVMPKENQIVSSQNALQLTWMCGEWSVLLAVIGPVTM